MVPPHPTLIPQRTGGGLFAPEHYKFKRLVVDHSSGTTARRPNGLSDKYMEHAKSIFHTDHSVFDGSEEVCVTAHLIGRSLATSLSQAGKFLTLRVNIGPKHVLADGTIRRSLDLDCPGNLFRADPSSHLLFDGKTGKPVDGNWGFLPVHWKAVADEVGMKDDRDFEEIAPGDVFPFHLVTLDNAEITRVVYEVQDPFIPPTPSPSSSSLANDEKEEASSTQHQTDGLIREGVQHDLEDQDTPSSEQHQSDDLIEEGADHNVANPTPESDPGPQNAPTPQTNVPRQGSLHTIQGIDSRIVWCTANPVLAEYELLGKLLARVENKSAWPPYQTNLYDYLQPRMWQASVEPAHDKKQDQGAHYSSG